MPVSSSFLFLVAMPLLLVLCGLKNQGLLASDDTVDRAMIGWQGPRYFAMSAHAIVLRLTSETNMRKMHSECMIFILGLWTKVFYCVLWTRCIIAIFTATLWLLIALAGYKVVTCLHTRRDALEKESPPTFLMVSTHFNMFQAGNLFHARNHVGRLAAFPG